MLWKGHVEIDMFGVCMYVSGTRRLGYRYSTEDSYCALIYLYYIPLIKIKERYCKIRGRKKSGFS